MIVTVKRWSEWLLTAEFQHAEVCVCVLGGLPGLVYSFDDDMFLGNPSVLGWKHEQTDAHCSTVM